ncbi:MAG TPA: ADOP family duplicated permease [Thermoanaerobaculia bacterium]|nr:ADOP family duplicated permease [Thermoanaerobaculia bacterium]
MFAARELRHAVRSISRRPAFFALAAAIVAIGIGANATLFAVLDAILLRPMPGIAQMDRLVAVRQTAEGEPRGAASWVDFRDFRERSRDFERMAVFKSREVDVDFGTGAIRLQGLFVSDGYFELLGLRPAMGRFFEPRESAAPGAEAVAVLGHALWRTRLASDPDVIGRSIRLNGRAYRIVGIAPAGFRGTTVLDEPAIFIPFMMLPHVMQGQGGLLENRGWSGVAVIGRLAEGSTLESAQASLGGIAASLAEQFPGTNEDRGVRVVPLAEDRLPANARARVERFGAIALGAAGMLLVMMCANLALLLLVRGISRARELAVRKALGSGGGALAGSVLLESMLVAMAGAAGGLLIAHWSVGMLRNLSLPQAPDVRLDPRVLLFTIAITALAALLFGSLPAMIAARADVAALLQGSAGRGRAGGKAIGARLLVSVQVGVSVLLLFLAALFVRTMFELRREGPGYESGGVVTFALDPTTRGEISPGQIDLYYDEVLSRLESRPEIIGASAATQLPLSGESDTFLVDYDGRKSDEKPAAISVQLVREGYFETLRMRMASGRSFAASDRRDAPPVVVVNESAARDLWPGESAIGKRVRPGGEAPWATVVGVVADSRLHGLRQKTRPFVFIPHRQAPMLDMGRRMDVLVRGRDGTEGLSAIVTAVVKSVDRDIPIVGLASLDDRLAEFTIAERLLSRVLYSAAAVASVLAGVGLFALLGYLVGRRGRELGIRMALGASQRAVLAGIVGSGIGMAIPGAAAGLLAGVALSRVVAPLLYRVEGTDPAALILVSALILAVSGLASLLPARRAASIDPAVSLRSE